MSRTRISRRRRGEAKEINFKHPKYKQYAPRSRYVAMGIGLLEAQAALRAEAAMPALNFAGLQIPHPPAAVIVAAYASRPKRNAAVVGTKLRQLRKVAARKMGKMINSLD